MRKIGQTLCTQPPVDTVLKLHKLNFSSYNIYRIYHITIYRRKASFFTSEYSLRVRSSNGVIPNNYDFPHNAQFYLVTTSFKDSYISLSR